MRTYAGPLYRYCYQQLRDHHLAEDVVQDVFLRVYRTKRSANIGNEPAWLFGIARHCCQELKRKTRRGVDCENSAADIARETPCESGSTTDLELALEALDDEEQSLLYMKYFKGLKCREITVLTGEPIGTITARLSRIYHKLRTKLQDNAGVSRGL